MKKVIKIILFVILMSLVFGSFSESKFIKDLLRLDHYYPEEIEQVKISQNKTRESADLWRSEEIKKRYKDSKKDLSRIDEIYVDIDNNYSRIIQIMEDGRKYLSPEDEKFLQAENSNLKDELERLRETVDIRLKIPTWKSEIKGIEITQNKYADFFKKNKSSTDIESDYSNFIDISNYIVSEDKIIISKLESNQVLSKEEIEYSINIRTEKMNKSIELFYRINKYIDGK